MQLVWQLRCPSKAEAYRKEYWVKRLKKRAKESLVTSGTGRDLGYLNRERRCVMTKAEIVAKLAEETKVTKKVATAMLDSLVNTVQAGLQDEGADSH